MNQVTFRPVSERPSNGSTVVYVRESWDGSELQLEVVDIVYVWYNDYGEYINYHDGDSTPCGFELVVLFGDCAVACGMWCYANDVERALNHIHRVTACEAKF